MVEVYGTPTIVSQHDEHGEERVEKVVKIRIGNARHFAQGLGVFWRKVFYTFIVKVKPDPVSEKLHPHNSIHEDEEEEEHRERTYLRYGVADRVQKVIEVFPRLRQFEYSQQSKDAENLTHRPDYLDCTTISFFIFLMKTRNEENTYIHRAQQHNNSVKNIAPVIEVRK